MGSDDGQERRRRQGSLAERFDRLTGRSLPSKVVLFAAGLVTAISTLTTAVVSVVEWRAKDDWRSIEYAKLGRLRAGHTLESFRAVLGAPLYRRTPNGGDLTYSTFSPRPEYWVDVVADSDGASVAFAVTSCYEDFRPTFTFRNGSAHSRVTLRATRFQDVEQSPAVNVKASRGGTSSSYAFHVFYGGNPTSYRSLAWGVNDTCAALTEDQTEEALEPWAEWHNRTRQFLEVVRPWQELGPSDRQRLGRVVVNTYAETDPFTEFSKVYPKQIDVDRITVRP
ncbi:hypothetical protein J7E93_01735 [Streptomyces sp. ISL-36]|uniref:ETEC_3214 domain-containing protein n=1 Tax=Streptomyces sp. ISL-36 TaxID=2819182 RepID=UPI001BE90DD6|nr:ETEC_3214 domain-containing protein [Streptomyces sp. ISL-36]MBT2438867.1 hypothetical protein [Streptomyces sp. ISL-36]